MTFLELAEKVLHEHVQPLTANEIWQKAVEKGYDKQLNSQGKTTWQTLYAQIYVSVKDTHKSPFSVTETRPKRFYLKKQKGKVIIDPVDEQGATDSPIIETPAAFHIAYLEKELHPFITYYAYLFQRCYTKTINHSKSTKKTFGEWVHPDMVGCIYPIDDWKNEVLEFSSAIGNVSVRILSFELKRELNFSNIRESFFQTVSNSSWANEAYLAAADISRDDEFMSELTRLSSSFGIGVIRIDTGDPNSTEIILPARLRDNLDWETINKLSMNRDFSEFLKRIKTDLTSREIRREKYDTIYEAEELMVKFNQKK